jgi:hypothetical protein
MACGVLTVLATERLATAAARAGAAGPGQAWHARLAGVVAGLMIALNPLHVVVNSHVAWSHATTPLWSTAGLWALLVGVEQRRPAALAWAGLLLGLALASHPTAALLVAGAGGYVLWRGRTLLETPWPWLALGLLVLVNLPFLVYNLRSDGDSFANARQVMTEYAGGQVRGDTVGWYLHSLGWQALLLAQALAGPLDLRPPTLATFADPLLVSYSIIAVVALGAALRRPYGLLLVLPCLGLFAGMAYLNTSKHEPVTDSRYLAPLLPPIATAIGCLAADLARSTRRTAPRIVVVALALAVAGLPVVHLIAYERRALAEEPNNDGMLAEARHIASAALPGEVVLLDARLNDVEIRSRGPADEAPRFRTIRYVLELAGVPYLVLPMRLDAQPLVTAGGASAAGRLVVLSTETTRGRTPGGLRASGLRGLDGEPVAEPRSAAGFAAYRVEAAPRAVPRPGG